MTLHMLELPHRKPARLEGLAPSDAVLGRIGNLEARLAVTSGEIRQAQRLRYRIFMEERGVAPVTQSDLLDRDHFDAFCDHLIVVDRDDDDRIVGTYRLLRQEMAALAGSFYSASYFEIASLVACNAGKRFLELGRSCVENQYRTKRTVELLWQGIWAYCQRHNIDVLTGCASFTGTDPYAHTASLSYLERDFTATNNWAVNALPERAHPMNLSGDDAIEAKTAFLALPPLMKGYLRVGAKVGSGCVIDHDLSTIVVMIVLPVDTIAERYSKHFSA